MSPSSSSLSPEVIIASSLAAVVLSAYTINSIFFETSSSKKKLRQWNNNNNNNKKRSGDSNDNDNSTPVELPPHVTSMIPYVGSGIEMGQQGITTFIRKYGNKLQSPVFTATILGNRCLFINDPELLTVVYKPSLSSSKSKKLDDLSLQKKFMSNALGMTDTELAESTDPVPLKATVQQYHKHLFKGEWLEVSISKVQESFRTLVIPSIEDTITNETSSSTATATTIKQDLYRFVQSAIFKASVGPFFSPLLATDEAVQAFRDFDKGVTLLFEGGTVPQFVTRVARAGRTELLKILQTDEFWNTAAPLMTERKTTGYITGTALDKGNLGLLWASSGNSAPAVFWAFAHLINDRKAWDACYEQVKSVAKTGPDHVFTLDELDQLTCLQSAFWEALRMYHGAFTSRVVVDDFVLETNADTNGNKGKRKFLIEKDTQVMSFWDILHSDPDIFEDPYEFKYDRFLNNDKPSDFSYRSGSKLSHSPMMAFGGGQHLCPGRKFISYENRLLMAMMMMHFDLRLAENETIPPINLAVQGVGVSQPKNDVVVEVTRRSM
mmetsp:Transcript_8841/g.22254  ORF Transcript_8841/g.22254 Transcript_8841/m.22254 type:complete len:551 (-) Transcript_8841:36-1688(-)